MTEKRFILVEYVNKGLFIQDNANDETQYFQGSKASLEKVVDLLNSLNDENEQLKKDCTVLIYHNQEYRKENEQLKQFKEKVFVLLDEKIKHYEHKPFSAPVGQPMSVNFDADVDRLARLSELQDLEKELQE